MQRRRRGGPLELQFHWCCPLYPQGLEPPGAKFCTQQGLDSPCTAPPSGSTQHRFCLQGNLSSPGGKVGFASENVMWFKIFSCFADLGEFSVLRHVKDAGLESGRARVCLRPQSRWRVVGGTGPAAMGLWSAWIAWARLLPPFSCTYPSCWFVAQASDGLIPFQI